jgi:hypothetical protein
MAGGPIGPAWSQPDSSGSTFPYTYPGSGSGNIPNTGPGAGVAASINSGSVDVTWSYGFDMPPTIPSGTMKLAVRALALSHERHGLRYAPDGQRSAGW